MWSMPQPCFLFFVSRIALQQQLFEFVRTLKILRFAVDLLREIPVCIYILIDLSGVQDPVLNVFAQKIAVV